MTGRKKKQLPTYTPPPPPPPPPHPTRQLSDSRYTRRLPLMLPRSRRARERGGASQHPSLSGWCFGVPITHHPSAEQKHVYSVTYSSSARSLRSVPSDRQDRPQGALKARPQCLTVSADKYTAVSASFFLFSSSGPG